MTRHIQESSGGDMAGIFKRLQDHRCKVKLKTSLLNAASRGDTPVVLAILDEGLSVDADNHGVTALFMAATDGRHETVEALLKRGADANAKDEEHSVTALMQAVDSGDVRIVRALLEAGAEVNVFDWMGQAALDYTDDTEIRDVLRRAGAEHGPEASALDNPLS
ncbi:MAG: ankyrin repeat domain-containing protein [Armatimonadota bacterium]